MPRQKGKREVQADAAASGPAIDLNNHIATQVAIFANRLSRAASRFYRERYGIGVVEWRVMMFIGHAKETSANRICSETDLDKGAVSRSLNVLARMGIVTMTEDGADSRRHNVALTAKGRALHDQIVPVALERQRHLLADLSPDEVEAFVDMIHRMQRRIAGGKASREKPAPRRSAAAHPTLSRTTRRGDLLRRRASGE